MKLRRIKLLFLGLLLVSLLQPILISVSTSQSFTKELAYTIRITDKYGTILGLLYCKIKIIVSYGYWSSYYGFIVLHFESSGNGIYQPPLRLLSLGNETIMEGMRDGSTWLSIGTTVLHDFNLNFEPGDSKREYFCCPNMSRGENGPILVVDPVVYFREEFDIRIEASDGQEWNSPNVVLFEISVSKENETYLVPQTYSIYAFNRVATTERPPSSECMELVSQYSTLSGSHDDLLMKFSNLQNEVSFLRGLVFGSIIVIVISFLAFAIYIKKYQA